MEGVKKAEDQGGEERERVDKRQWTDGERERECVHSAAGQGLDEENDSKRVIKHRYTSKGRATGSAYTGGDYASK